MQQVHNHEDLVVWQRGMDLVVAVYTITKQFPNEERFGLTNQIRRAVASVPANIAEGHGRFSRPDYLRFLAIARGSLMEVRIFLRIAERLHFIEVEQLNPVFLLADDTGRLLNGLIRSLRGAEVREEIEPYNVDDQLLDHEL